MPDGLAGSAGGRDFGSAAPDLTDAEDVAFVAVSASMLQAVDRLRKVAPLDTTVLLTGESGTGKEVAARFLHSNHPRRRGGPFVCVHCGAIPDGLLESELFGHLKGAFTSADRDRTGKFELAHGGTLFLDEISTMKPEAQVRLLRVLQERRVSRVGGGESRPVDVRVVVASNQDLKALLQSGGFRLDLYYRISAFPVELPPLRERPADLVALVEVLSRRIAARIGLEEPKPFTAEALRAMSAYHWPGNVRELENTIEYASILSSLRDQIGIEDLPEEISGAPPSARASGAGVMVTDQGLSFRSAVSSLERDLILQSMRLADGNKARAAELLDLKRTTFLEKLRRLEEEGLLAPDQLARSSADAGDTTPS
jgi:DNA-binding NtrC family response regulator